MLAVSGIDKNSAIHLVARIAYAATLEVQPMPYGRVALTWGEAPEVVHEYYKGLVEKCMAGASLEAVHNNWVRYAIPSGWVLSSVEDVFRKKSPLVAEFTELSDELRTQKRLVWAIIYAALTALGFPPQVSE